MYHNMMWDKKPNSMDDFEPNSVNLFRVILDPNFHVSLLEVPRG